MKQSVEARSFLRPELEEGAKRLLTDALADTRARTLALIAPLPDLELVRQHSPLMSPIVWDLAHVGNFEEQWLLRALGGSRLASWALDEVYDAFRHPRSTRPTLPLLSPPLTRRYLADVRHRALERLSAIAFDSQNPLLANGFVYGMVIQHEQQHDETILACLQLMSSFTYRPPSPHPPVSPPGACNKARYVEGGPFVMGTDEEPWAYDNERPAHLVDLRPFLIDSRPITNREFIEFIEAGGYRQQRYWSREGWAFREKERLLHPQYWQKSGREWRRRRFGFVEPLPPDEPVQHVCWYEADAYARWAGKRLPTEAEWEKAASWTPSGRKLRYPWGDDPPTAGQANLGGQRFQPAPAGSFPEGRSPRGCEQLLGDVWEWTASDFQPYPGFVAFPYREYSEVFFGTSYKVLRGGSWATHSTVIRNTFRNWDFPTRRHIFAGFRCAQDV